MSAEGSYKVCQTIGIYTAGTGRGFTNPVDVAIGREGTLYVLSRGASETAARMPMKRVTMCTLEEDYLGEFSTGGTRDGQLMWPVSIATDRDGNVYISDEALHRISIFDSPGRFLGGWGVRGNRNGELDGPAGMAFDKDDNLLIVDSVNNRIQRFTRDGTFLDAWGRGGSADGEFDLPWGISIDQAGDVYVADWRNDRIQKFDPAGRHLATWGGSGRGDGEFDRPTWPAVDRDGNIFVADWGNERLQLIDQEGSLIAKFRGEAGISRWAQEYLMANPEELEARQNANMEPEVDPELSPIDFLRYQSASVEKYFWGPTSVKIDGEGKVYVVDSCRHRIQVYGREAGAARR